MSVFLGKKCRRLLEQDISGERALKERLLLILGVKRSLCPSEASLDSVCAHHPICCCQGPESFISLGVMTEETLLGNPTWDCGRSTMSHETPVPGRETVAFQISFVI